MTINIDRHGRKIEREILYRDPRTIEKASYEPKYISNTGVPRNSDKCASKQYCATRRPVQFLSSLCCCVSREDTSYVTFSA